MSTDDRVARLARPVIGLLVSGGLMALALSRIDIGEVGQALVKATPLGLFVALVLVAVEVGLRGRRWQILLDAARPVAYPRAVMYLCVGYFANSFLPARLGDVARAHLAGTRLGIDRFVTLGTIVVERVADASIILVAVVVLSVVTPSAHDLLRTAVAIGIAGCAGLGVALFATLLARRSGRQAPMLVAKALALAGRIGHGAAAIRSPRRFASVVVITVVAFAIAVAEYWTVAAAVGLTLTPMEAAIVMGALALSTSIPAAPGSLGTYEFVGLTVLLGMGAPAGAALASVVLMHVVATVPPALVGMVATWSMHLRISPIDEPLIATPARAR